MSNGYRVTQTIVGAHPIHQDYPLYEGDILTREDDGSFFKEGPGLGISGFRLSEDQVDSLEPINFKHHGLHYHILDNE